MKNHRSPEADISRSLRLAAGCSFILFLIKLMTFIASGSLLLLASVFDSLADSVNSLINHYVHKISRSQPDREHPFGHGGFEVVGSLVQGLFILFLGVGLLQESLRKVFDEEAGMHEPERLPLAAIVLLFSAAGGLLIQRFLSAQAKRLEKRNERSLSLLADRAHYTGDAIVNLLSSAGIMLVYKTGMISLDGVLGALGAFFLMGTGYPILYKAFRDIVHREAPPKLQQDIINLVFSLDQRIKGVHQFRSRELGHHLFVDFHMKVPDLLPVREAHDLAAIVQKNIIRRIPGADVLIRIDPESEAESESWSPSWNHPGQRASEDPPG